MGEYHNLYHELAISPDHYDIPAWIYAEKEGGYVREYFEQSLSFMLYGKPGSEPTFIKRLSHSEYFNKELFFTLIPEILDSVLDDSHMQRNFEGFFSQYMTNLISVNSANLGIDGIKKIKKLCKEWEQSLGNDRDSRLGITHDWGIGKEYQGFKNTLDAILSFS